MGGSARRGNTAANAIHGATLGVLPRVRARPLASGSRAGSDQCSEHNDKLDEGADAHGIGDAAVLAFPSRIRRW
jgi:hypothetical protein